LPIKKSAANNNIELSPIGLGQIENDWESSLFKQRALYEAVRDLDDDEIVCATDGFDVFYQQDSEYLKKHCLALNTDVVFSAVKGFSHQYANYKHIFDSRQMSSPYKYLNAGNVIGYAGALRILYRPRMFLRLKAWLSRNLEINRIGGRLTREFDRLGAALGVRNKTDTFSFPWYCYTDQAIMAKYYATGKYDISIDLDIACTLFWSTAYEWDDIDEHYKLVEGKLQNIHTGNFPACIHVPYTSKYEKVFLRLYESVHGTEKKRE
jgi:hypothetical protein